MPVPRSRLSMGALHLLRQTLLRFFQDKRVKVSLFLQVRGLRVCALSCEGRGAHGVPLGERRSCGASKPTDYPPRTHALHPTQEGIQSSVGRIILPSPASQYRWESKGDAWMQLVRTAGSMDCSSSAFCPHTCAQRHGHVLRWRRGH